MRTSKTRKSPDIVLFGDFPAKGGAPRVLANMIPYWRNHGYQIAIVTHRSGECFYPQEIGDQVTHVHLGSKNKYITLFKLWYYLFRKRPRIIHSTSHVDNSIIARLGVLPSTGVLRVGSVHNTFGQSRRADPAKKARKLANVRRLYRYLDGVIAVSEGIRQDLKEVVGLRSVPVHAIPNGVVTPEVAEKSKEPISHPWLGPDRDEPVVLAVGRLAKQKDYPNLLEAVSLVRKERPCRLIILGDGPLRDELQEKARKLGIAELVDFPGFVENPYSWMARSDCFAMSSQWEGCPCALAEALAMEIPVVSTDCPSGPTEILNGGQYGWLVPMEDSFALADAIQEALNKGGKEFNTSEAVEPYTAERAAKRYLEVFGVRENSGAEACT